MRLNGVRRVAMAMMTIAGMAAQVSARHRCRPGQGPVGSDAVAGGVR